MTDIRVVQRDSRTGKITFEMGQFPKRVTGVDKLVQTFILTLLNDPGQDVLDPYRGGGLLGMIGQQNFASSDPTPLFDTVYTAVDKAIEDVISAQSGLTDEDPESMLRTAQVLDIQEGDSIDSVSLRIRLISMAGTEVDLSV